MADVPIAHGANSLGTPSSGDSIYILGGNTSIDTAVDQSALAAGLVNFEVSRAYTAHIGSSGNPVYVEITGRLIYAAQSGSMYYRGKDAGDATVLIQIHTGGEFHAVTDGTATRFEMGSGVAKIYGPFIATNIRMGGGYLTILDDTSTDPTLIHMMSGGTVFTERGMTTGTVDQGTLIIEAGTNAITTLNCSGPPQVARTILTESGTITTLNATGHIPDTTKLTNPMTITNTTINMTLPGAAAFLQNPLITFTNAATEYISDGRVW